MAMNREIHEQLSALMDGELGRDETRFLVRRVESDGELTQRWTRYHVVRQAVRRQPIFALRTDFARSVMAGIEHDEVTVSGGHRWLRMASGGAIAAAVAVAALMITRPAGESRPPSVATSPSPVAVQPAGTQLAGVSRQPTLVPNSPIQTANASYGTDLVQPASFDPRMQSYVIRHYEATGSAGQPDFVPYILLVPPAARPGEPRQVENR